MAVEKLNEEELSDLAASILEGTRFSAPRLVFRETKPAESLSDFTNKLKITTETARILKARGIDTVDAAKAFLFPTLREHLPNPCEMLNLEAAAELILDFALEKKQITVFHDFDVDGLTAGAQLAEFLKALDANVRCYVPNRVVEGYGLSIAGIDTVIKAGCELLVTVDCGISNVEEIEYAKKNGLRVIILDHHQPSELPAADVIVDPAQEGCPFQKYKLAAAGVVWMLLIVLRSQAIKRKVNQAIIPNPKDFLDLAALGTICDMVPLNELNRLIAYRGLELMRNTRRVGLRALMEVAGVFGKSRFGAGQVSFALGPRINAAGRLDDASHVGELFATKDLKRAKRLAEKIDKLNTQRRTIEEQVKKSCFEIIKSDPQTLKYPALAVYGDEFHQGVIGIVAQRLVEEFHRPAAVMAPAEMEYQGKLIKIAKGSVRSIKGFDVAEVLHGMDDILISGGGHSAAGGFSVAFDRVAEFREAFIFQASKRLSSAELQREIKADISTPLAAIDFTLAEELHQLAPFGVGNSSPVLVTENIIIDSTQPLLDKHLKLRLSDGKTTRQAIAWGFMGHPKARKGQEVTVVYQVEINTYKGVSSVQLNIKAIL